ncbi:hypothetical protein ARMGADRAFT_1067983 [Armillaria gallica]|uniref:Uncharacterized protein n=1 Tax=Armillaria gallica TaxID=47427 RepID=A0A2H3CIT1_ARMGA|nr:hypothetical protein ARMGADRAFT_1067983 [Armillaria gallica]
MAIIDAEDNTGLETSKIEWKATSGAIWNRIQLCSADKLRFVEETSKQLAESPTEQFNARQSFGPSSVVPSTVAIDLKGTTGYSLFSIIDWPEPGGPDEHERRKAFYGHPCYSVIRIHLGGANSRRKPRYRDARVLHREWWEFCVPVGMPRLPCLLIFTLEQVQPDGAKSSMKQYCKTSTIKVRDVHEETDSAKWNCTAFGCTFESTSALYLIDNNIPSANARTMVNKCLTLFGQTRVKSRGSGGTKDKVAAMMAENLLLLKSSNLLHIIGAHQGDGRRAFFEQDLRIRADYLKSKSGTLTQRCRSVFVFDHHHPRPPPYSVDVNQDARHANERRHPYSGIVPPNSHFQSRGNDFTLIHLNLFLASIFQQYLRFGTREYSTQLMGVPKGEDGRRCCKEKSIIIHGIDVEKPGSCTVNVDNSGVVLSELLLGPHEPSHFRSLDGLFYESSCETLWKNFQDKIMQGCVATGSKTRRIEAYMCNHQPSLDNWQEICSATSAD